MKSCFSEEEIKKKLSQVRTINPRLYNLLLEKIEFNRFHRFRKIVRQVMRKILAIGVKGYFKGLLNNNIVQRINDTASNKKKVLFVAGTPTFNLIGISVYLRKTGEYETILIVESPWLISFFKQYFDDVYTYNCYYDVASILIKSQPYIVHVQGMPNYYFLGVLAKALSRAAVICGFIDIPSFARFNELSKESKNFQLDYFSEEFILKNGDGAIFVTEANVSDDLRSQYNTNTPLLDFHPYICDEFIKEEEEKYSGKNNKIYLVYGGLVAPSDKPRIPFGIIQFFELAKKLIAQGLYFHMYLPPTYSPLIVKKLYSDYIQLSNESLNFAFKQGISLDKVASEFSRYDFAMIVSIFKGIPMDEINWKTCVPSKFFTYLAAGLPIIVNKEHSYIASLIEKYEIGIVISQNEIDSLVDVIRKYDYEKLILNVKKAREEFSMKNHIGRLIELYELAHAVTGKAQ